MRRSSLCSASLLEGTLPWLKEGREGGGGGASKLSESYSLSTLIALKAGSLGLSIALGGALEKNEVE